jgi:NADPH2:quinone reductase
VIAAARGADKLAVARAHGADHTIDYQDENHLRAQVLELTGGRGADVIYDPVGGSIFDVSLRCIAPEGRLIPMGFASGRIPQIPANILLVKNVTVIGFYYGYYNGWSRDETDPALARRRNLVREAMRAMLRWYEDGKLKALVAGSYPLERAVEAFKLVEDRKVIGKAVLDPRLPS